MYLVKNNEHSENLERREQIAIDFIQFANLRKVS